MPPAFELGSLHSLPRPLVPFSDITAHRNLLISLLISCSQGILFNRPLQPSSHGKCCISEGLRVVCVTFELVVEGATAKSQVNSMSDSREALSSPQKSKLA